MMTPDGLVPLDECGWTLADAGQPEFMPIDTRSTAYVRVHVPGACLPLSAIVATSTRHVTKQIAGDNKHQTARTMGIYQLVTMT